MGIIYDSGSESEFVYFSLIFLTLHNLDGFLFPLLPLKVLDVEGFVLIHTIIFRPQSLLELEVGTKRAL